MPPASRLVRAESLRRRAGPVVRQPPDRSHSRLSRNCSNNDRVTFRVRVALSQGLDRCHAATLDWAKISEEDLILAWLQDVTKPSTEPNILALGELAPKDGVLEMVPKPSEGAEDLVSPPVVADVVRKRKTVLMCSARPEIGVRVELAEKEAPEESRLHVKGAPVTDAVAEHRVRHELVHAPLVSGR